MSIRIVTIGGSVRPGNFTAKALALVNEELGQMQDVTLDVIDPRELELAFPGQHADAAATTVLQERVTAATGVVLATPEYHGSYSGVMKVVIENLGFPSVLAGKPVALLGVAAGAIGAIKALEHLRSVCSHIGAIVLPGPVSVAGVSRIFDEDGRCADAVTEKRVRGIARQLRDYIDQSICPRITLEAMARDPS